MRTRTAIATAITGGALVAALVTSPAIAAGARGVDPGSTDDRPVGECDGSGRDWSGTGRGLAQGDQDGTARMRGPRAGAGGGAGLADVPSGTLTDAQEATLAAMAEEEKLAHDLYAAFAEEHSSDTFTRIANSEARHLEAVRVLLDRYELADPTADKPAGTFASKSVQESYDAALAEGSKSLDAAYGVGRTVETTDISDLKSALDGLTAPDVQRVYNRLLTASQRHLEVFEG